MLIATMVLILLSLIMWLTIAAVSYRRRKRREWWDGLTDSARDAHVLALFEKLQDKRKGV